ncbi:MAG: hypothetical protein K1X79_13180 [Oligoflexia bacterium]|nr:hypothetical protein [Oligoflexia bacterium]
MRLNLKLPALPILILSLAHICLFAAGLEELRALGATLILLSPGLCFCYRFLRTQDGVERLFIGLALGLACSVLFLFGLSFCPSALTGHTLLIIDLVCAITLLLGNAVTAPPPRELAPRIAALLVVLLIAAGSVRFWALRYPEFQGDEARAMILASATYQGQNSVLFAHKKGPTEILLPFGMASLTQRMSEEVARFPFAVAGLLVLLGTFVLGRAIFPRFGSASGLAACAVLAIDGFLIAFSRIVQYQSILLVCALGAALALLRSRQAGPGSTLWLGVATLLCVAGLYSHYDMLLVLPALLYLSRSKNLPGNRLSWKLIINASCAAALLLALFFVPFLLHEKFGQTSSYLATRLGLQQLPTNNVGRYMHLLTFYSSTFFVYPLALVLSVLIGQTLFRSTNNKVFHYGLFLCWLAGLLLSTFAPQVIGLEGKRSLAILLMGPPLALAAYRVHGSAHRFLATWAALGFITFSFFFARPNTHYYVIHPALALLVASYFVENALNWKLSLRLGAGTVFGVCGLLAFSYVCIAFMRTSTEFRVQFPRSRPVLYLAPFGDKLPAGAFFGFPRASGWRAIGALISQHSIVGSYSSNEEALITAWYTRGALREEPRPDWYFIAQNANDPIPVSETLLKHEYYFWGRVYVNDQRRLDIFRRTDSSPMKNSPPSAFKEEQLRAVFDDLGPATLDIAAALPSLAQSR